MLSIGVAVLDNLVDPKCQRKTSWNTPLAEYKQLFFTNLWVSTHILSCSLTRVTKSITIHHSLKNNSRKNDRSPTVRKIHTMPRFALVVHKTVRMLSKTLISLSINCSTAVTQPEASTDYKNILLKRVSLVHNQKLGRKTSCKNALEVAKHNSDSEVNVITIFGNCNVASRGIRRIQFTVQLLPAHRMTSHRNSQKGIVQLGIISPMFAESIQTAQAMPNNRKSPSTSTTSTSTAASKKIPGPGNNTFYSIQILSITAITKPKAKSKVASETPPKVPKRTLGGRKLGVFVPTEAALDSVGDPMNSHPIEIEDKEIDELRQIELEIPELWLFSTRQDATTFKEDTFWVRIGFTLAKSTHELAMSEILAAARARAEKIDHLDWTTGPDPRYGFGEIEVRESQVTTPYLISLKSPNYHVHFLPVNAVYWGTKTNYIGIPTEETIGGALCNVTPRPVAYYHHENKITHINPQKSHTIRFLHVIPDVWLQHKVGAAKSITFRPTATLEKVCYVQPDLQVMPKVTSSFSISKLLSHLPQIPHAVVHFERNYIGHSVQEWRNWLRENLDVTTTVFSNTVALIPKPGSDALFSAAVILMGEDEAKALLLPGSTTGWRHFGNNSLLSPNHKNHNTNQKKPSQSHHTHKPQPETQCTSP